MMKLEYFTLLPPLLKTVPARLLNLTLTLTLTLKITRYFFRPITSNRVACDALEAETTNAE